VWVGSVSGPYLYRINPRNNRVRRIHIGEPQPAWLAASADAVWVANGGSGTVFRIDPATNRIVARIRVGEMPVDGTVASDGSVWIPVMRENAIAVIDPATNTVRERIAVGPSPFVVNEAFGDMWAPSFGGDDVWRIRR
jgi:virginiamycin B lyase